MFPVMIIWMSREMSAMEAAVSLLTLLMLAAGLGLAAAYGDLTTHASAPHQAHGLESTDSE